VAEELQKELQNAIWSYLAKAGDPVPSVEVKLENAETISGEIFLAFGFLRHEARADLTRAAEHLREGFDNDAVLPGRFRTFEIREQDFFHEEIPDQGRVVTLPLAFTATLA
jgi:hypothetical protein